MSETFEEVSFLRDRGKTEYTDASGWIVSLNRGWGELDMPILTDGARRYFALLIVHLFANYPIYRSQSCIYK